MKVLKCIALVMTIFCASQLTAQNYKYMLLYIGENIYEQQYYSGITHIYANFFEVNDIKVDEQNIHDYRELARIYAGWVKSESVKTPNTFVPTNQKFIDYLTANIFNPKDSFLLHINAIDTAVKLTVNNNANKPNFKNISIKSLTSVLPSSLIKINSAIVV